MSFFEELKRRNVFRVGIAYAIAAWVLLQVADLVLDNINAPEWVIQAMMLMVGLGFIAALVIAWAYELTPEGIKREVDVDRSLSVAPQTGQKLDRIVIGFLVIAVLVLLYRQSGDEKEKGSGSISPAEAVSNVVNDTANLNLTPFPAPVAQPDKKSIAVLPFVNMSSDPEQEYFSDGITEEILNRLAKIQGLQVAARTSVFSFKGQNKDIRELAEMLGVSTMLEGSVRRDGEQVRITAQLIRASDGFHLWSETYDRKIDSIFAVQDEISEQIAAALQVSLGISPVGSNARQVTDPEVYDLYLRARALFRQRGRSVIEALNLFQRAVEIDPDFAPAWAGLAHTYTVLFAFLEPEELPQFGDTSAKSMDAAQRALALDPNLPTALHAMANNLHFQFRFAEADEYFQKAILLDPDSTDIMEDYAHFLCYTWQNEKAGIVADRMIELDPFVPIFRFAAIDVAQGRGEIEKRNEHILKGLEVNPGFSILQTWNLRRLMEQKRFDEAREYTGTMDFRGQASASGMRQMVSWVENPAGTMNTEMREALSYMPELALYGGDNALYIKTIWTDKQLNSSEIYLAYMIEFESSGAMPWSKELIKQPETKTLIKQAQLPEYWRQVGWPPQCRPIGADDFECS